MNKNESEIKKVDSHLNYLKLCVTNSSNKDRERHKNDIKYFETRKQILILKEQNIKG
jgi:hypothetical protein